MRHVVRFIGGVIGLALFFAIVQAMASRPDAPAFASEYDGL